MKIALAQMKMDTDIEKNFQKSLQLICEAAERRAFAYYKLEQGL